MFVVIVECHGADSYECAGGMITESLGEENKRASHFRFVKGNRLKVSVPELTAYEIASTVHGSFSFEHSAELFQGLINLSPRKSRSVVAIQPGSEN
jgi:hypothetical protein